MDAKMSQKTRKELLENLQKKYRKAGREYRRQLVDHAIDLLGYHPKAAYRALSGKARKKTLAAGSARLAGRPLYYDAGKLLEPLKIIWLAGQQPCGRRLQSMMSEWVPAFEQYHYSLPSSTREQLLQASSATLDRLLKPLRALHQSPRIKTKPGSMLRKEIPIRGGSWDENEPGWIEADTVSLCGGQTTGECVHVVDGTDIFTTWVEMRAIYGRGQHSTLEQLQDIERTLPFPLLGLDSDNGGEFINRHVLRWCQKDRQEPIYYTRSRPYQSNDNAHVEQKNWTHVRQWFGYERHDNPEVVQRMNDLSKGALGDLLNLFTPSMKLVRKTKDASGREHRVYDRAQTPYQRVISCPQVPLEKRDQIKKRKAGLNPFALAAQIQKDLKQIDRCRRGA